MVLFGDEAPVDQKSVRAVRSVQWSSPLSKAPTLEKKLLIGTSNALDPLHKVQERALDSVAAWSFNVATENTWPKHDWDGKAFNSYRSKMAGQLLREDGVVPILVGTIGDWMFSAKTFGFAQNWISKDVCECCGAHTLPTEGRQHLGRNSTLSDVPTLANHLEYYQRWYNINLPMLV